MEESPLTGAAPRSSLLAEPKPPIVEIRNLSKSYHRESLAVPVLHDITFDIAEGEFSMGDESLPVSPL